MANTKISALTAGTPAQNTDVLPIARAGANFSLTAADMVALAAATLAPIASPTFTGTATSPVFNTSGSNGGITGTEGNGSGLTAGAGIDLLWPDSTAHRWKMNNNNGTTQLVTGISAAGTAGNLVKLAANGVDLADSGAPSTVVSTGYVIPTGLPFPLGLAQASLVGSQNETDCIRFIAPFTITCTRVSYIPTTSAGVGTHVGFAIYSSDGTTRIMTTGALDGTLTGKQTVTVSSFTLNAGTAYLLCWTTDASTSTTWAAYAYNVTAATLNNLINQNTKNLVKGTTASSGGAPPTSLSTLITLTSGISNIPAVFIEP